MSSALKRLAVGLFKIGSDLRLSASGPRCGLQELTLPANEPGSSIMPGKVNPTQVEALTMACVQVIGNDTAITMAGTQGHFQLNVFKPVMIYNLLQSIRILGDVAGSFDVHCVRGVEVNKKVVRQNLHSSLMLVTALNQHIGYDKASIIAKKAYKSGSSLREACVELGYMTGAEFDAAVDPVAMCNL
jgi:fumarate hydratase class II